MSVHNILVAVDFRSPSYEALALARTLSDALGASLHLLHVIGYPLATRATVAAEESEAARRLDAVLERDDRERRRASIAVRVGTPAREITDYAAEHDIDLIVMGTHCHGPTHGMVTGSIAEEVLGLARCAVLAVKCTHTTGAARQQPSSQPRLRCVWEHALVLREHADESARHLTLPDVSGFSQTPP